MTWTEDQTVLYDYDMSMLKLLNSNGVLSTDRPSPLTREEIVPVLEKIAKQPVYKNQVVVCHDKEFEPVVLKDGEVMP